MKNTFLRVLVTVAIFMAIDVRAEQTEFAFVLKGKGNPFWKTVVDGVRETAAARGIHAVIYQLDNDQASEEQLNICQTALERQPRVLVLGASTKTVGIQCFKEAARRKVIFADIDANVTVQDAKDAGLSMAFSVGSDNYQIGRQAADVAKSILKSGKPKILMLGGLVGSIVSNNRLAGFKDRVKEILPEAEIVASMAADWDRLKAATITTDLVQREPDLDLIYSVSDVMTPGIVEAIKVNHGSRDLQILSVDGNSDVRKAIMDGTVYASVAQLPYLMGKRAVELAVDSVSKPVVGYTEHTPIPVLTRGVLQARSDPNLVYVR